MGRRGALKGIWVLMGVLVVCSVVFAATESMTGVISARPEAEAADEWVIGGTVFVVSSVTQYDETEADLVVGGCAEVSYVVDNGGDNQALRIVGRSESRCN